MGRLVVATSLVLGGASCRPAVDGDDGGRGAGDGAGGGAGGAESTAATGGGGDDDCDPSGLEGSESEAICACESCEADGGICETECYFATGVWSINCFRPLPPGPDEFSCLGLVTCPLSQVCVHISPGQDGCTDTLCKVAPLACAENLTCECVAQFLTEEDRCSAEGAGVLVYMAGSSYEPDFWWQCQDPPCE